MYFLIVWEMGREHVLWRGQLAAVEALARKLRTARLFRYVRVDSRAPPWDAPARKPSGHNDLRSILDKKYGSAYR